MQLYRNNFPDIDNNENITMMTMIQVGLPSDENHTIGYHTCLIVY